MTTKNASISLRVNGQPFTLAGRTLPALFRALGVRAARVAVVLNDDVVPAARRGRVRLAAGDRVEIVTLAGGG